MESKFTPREQVVEVINRLFFYTDYQEWDKLVAEVFTEEVLLDMVSVGAEKAEMLTARQICQAWEEGFKGLDAIHHQAGNYIVDLKEKTAEVKAYAIASHYKKEAANGPVREFIGSYDFQLQLTEKGWRINVFKYNLKYLAGNVELT